MLSHLAVSLNFMQELYCFCPELLLEGDDHNVFSLFNKLLCVLERSGSVSSCDSKAAAEELVTYVVDLRARHVTSGGSAEDISDIVSYLLGDYNFVSRKNLCRVFKLCCLVVQKPVVEYAAVDMDLGDCAVPPIVVASCIRGVQSCISAAGYKQRSFFTQHTLESIRSANAGARGFMSSSTFDPWDGICSDGYSAFVERYCALFDTHLNRKKEESYQHLRGNSKGSGNLGVSTASCSKGPSPSAAPGVLASDVETTSSSVRRS